MVIRRTSLLPRNNSLQGREMGPSISSPCRLVVSGVSGSFLAVAYGIDQLSVYPKISEQVLRAIGPFLTEHQVILDGTPLIAVSFDSRRILLNAFLYFCAGG
jgi:hypothetical protein